MNRQGLDGFRFQYFIIIALLGYRVNDCLTKLLVTDLGVFGILFFRSLFTLALLPLFLIFSRINYKCFFERNIFIRNLLAAIALFFEVASLQYLSLSTFILLTYISPVCTKLFARLFLHEEISLFEVFVIIVSIIGTLFILDFSFEKEYTEGVIYAVLGAVFYSLSIIVTKKVKNPDTMSIYVSYVVVLFLLSAIKMPLNVPETKEVLILFVMASIHIAAFLLSLKGLLALKTSRAAVLEYLGLVFAVLLDYIFWNKLLSIPQLFGGLLIIGSSTLSVYRDWCFCLFKKIYVFLRKPAASSVPNANE